MRERNSALTCRTRKWFGIRITSTSIHRLRGPLWARTESYAWLASPACFQPTRGRTYCLRLSRAQPGRAAIGICTLYGKGNMRNLLERLLARFGLSERVTFAGFVNSIEDIWASNHVLVMPSRLEGLPLAMVEAMLCARPVLTTDVGGHSEIVVDGVTGFLAESAHGCVCGADPGEALGESSKILKIWERPVPRRIRELVPADPARVFSEKLRLLMS